LKAQDSASARTNSGGFFDAPTSAASDEAHTCWRTAMTGNGRAPNGGLRPHARRTSPIRILEGFAQEIKAQVPSVPAVAVPVDEIDGYCTNFSRVLPVCLKLAGSGQKSKVPMVFVFVRCASLAGLNAIFVCPMVCGDRDTAG
jgi:hypothetical protein